MKQPEFDIDIDQTEEYKGDNTDKQFSENSDKFECQFEKKYAFTILVILNLALIVILFIIKRIFLILINLTLILQFFLFLSWISMTAALKPNQPLISRSPTENAYLFFSILGFIIEISISVAFFFNLYKLIAVKMISAEYFVC